MKKVLIVGAGAQGGSCAAILAKDKGVEEIVLGDIDFGLTKKVKEKIASNKITALKLNAGDVDDVARAAEGAAAIINLTLTEFDMNIMEAALKSGSHYVDTSFGEPNLMDIRARDNILVQIIEKRPLVLDKEFKESGLTALIGCGGSPGTANVMTRYVCDKMDRVDEIRIRLGTNIEPSKEEMVSAWRPTWSPFRALWGYAIEPTMFVDGQYKKYPIFSCPEEYFFPDPVGPVLVTYHQHQEPITLPHFIGKGIKYCDFKYPVDALAGTFVKMGFGNPDEIEVKGQKVVPRDVLLKLVEPPVNTFFSEDENSAKQPSKMPVSLVVEVKGSTSGQNLAYSISSPFSFYQTPEEQYDVFRKLGTTMIQVALPAIVGAKMCVNGDANRGVIFPECLDPVKYFKMTADFGVPVKLHEVVSKEVTF